jgi:hypothetical protein
MPDAEQPDPMLDEIRAIREQISREHGDDLDRLFEHYVEYEKQFKGRLISRTMTPDEELVFRKGLEELRCCNPDDLELLASEVPAPASPPRKQDKSAA